jgi:cysteine desulfurase
MTRVYLDHNATTALRPEARDLWLELVGRLHGNPSSVHAAGRDARQVLDEARERTAAALGVHEDEIVFTSGGTESNNLALLGSLADRARPSALVTTQVEHSSVLGAGAALESRGHRVVRAPVDAEGQPRIDALLDAAAGPDVGLVSVMAANNEVGSVSRISEIAAGLRRIDGRRPRLHTDAVQALGKIPIRLRDWDVDLASFSAHKVGGPLGVGFLYKRKGVALEGLVFGGEQEGGVRPGTENVPAIAAASVAVEIAVREQPAFRARASELCLLLWQEVERLVPGIGIHGPPIDAPSRLPNTLNLKIPGADGRTLVARLDLEGLEVSAGSACASGSLEPSHVLLAMGASPDVARSGLRVSLGRSTTAQDIHTTARILRITIDATR